MAGFVSALALAGCGGAAENTAAIAGDLMLEQAREFADFPLLYAGDRLDGLPLVAIVHRDDTADYVSFVYGDCRPVSSDGACAPPAEVQVWPASRRSPRSHDAARGGAPPELTRIRGSPAAFFDAGTRLEVYTAEVSIVVFARTRAKVERAADALRCVGSVSSSPRPESLAC